MTILDFAKRYFDYNNLSEGRRQDILRALRSFEEITGLQCIEVTADAFQEWLAQLVENELAPTTVRKYGNALRGFVRHAWEKGEIDADTLLRIKAVKDPRGANKSEPNPYAYAEVMTLFDLIDRAHPVAGERALKTFYEGGEYTTAIAHHAKRLQLRAIVGLAFWCGLRRAEILRASTDDISHLNEYVVVRYGKSKHHAQPKYREVPHGKKSRAVVAEWLTFREGLFRVFGYEEHSSPWLVLDRRALGSTDAFESHPLKEIRPRKFNGLLTAFGFELHRLRHTCATLWLRAGMEMVIVQRYLGHSDIRITQGYVKITSTDVLKQVVAHEEDFGA